MSYSRIAIYYVPPEGDLADFGAAWLGWDIVRGRPARQAFLPGLNDITMTPRKYGFHGTLKPPFRMAEGRELPELKAATHKLAASLAPVRCDGFELAALGGFLALVPRGDMAALQRVADACVQDLDAFRAPASEEEMARRRKAGLNARQDALLQKWGYPYVGEEFRFHMTLSGRLSTDDVSVWTARAKHHLPDLPAPFIIDQIALCGERRDGCFELLHRYALAG